MGTYPDSASRYALTSRDRERSGCSIRSTTFLLTSVRHGEDAPTLSVRSTLACHDEGERKRHEVKVMHLLYYAQRLRDSFSSPGPGIATRGPPRTRRVVESIILLVQHVFAYYCPELTGIAYIRPALTEIKFITISKTTPSAQHRHRMPSFAQCRPSLTPLALRRQWAKSPM